MKKVLMKTMVIGLAFATTVSLESRAQRTKLDGRTTKQACDTPRSEGDCQWCDTNIGTDTYNQCLSRTPHGKMLISFCYYAKRKSDCGACNTDFGTLTKKECLCKWSKYNNAQGNATPQQIQNSIKYCKFYVPSTITEYYGGDPPEEVHGARYYTDQDAGEYVP
jgi:hypothetical protein